MEIITFSFAFDAWHINIVSELESDLLELSRIQFTLLRGIDALSIFQDLAVITIDI